MDKFIDKDEYPGIDDNLTDSNVVIFKLRNVRDNIFVLNAGMNNIIRKNIKNIDIEM